MAQTINFLGTGGIIEGNLETANVNVNLDAALDFDGSNDIVDLNYGSGVNAQAGFSVSFWAKLDDNFSGTNQMFIGSSTGTNQRFYIGIDGYRWSFGYASSGWNESGSQTAFAGAWHHVCVTTTSGAQKLYVNGVEITAQAKTDSSTFTLASDLAAGAMFGGAYHSNGVMADIKIFGDVLTAAEVQELSSKINYNISVGSIDNLTRWFKCNQGTGATIADDSGNSGTAADITGATWIFDQYSVNVQDNSTTTDGTFTVTQGKVEGKALSSVDFESDQDYGKIAFASTITQSHDNMSIACWIKRENATGQDDTIIGKSDFPHHHYLQIDTDGDIRYKQYPNTLDTGAVVTDTNWHHIIVTLQGDNNGAIYLDGVAQTLTTNNVTADGTFDQIGLRGDSGDGAATADEFDGKMRDVRFYDFALSVEQAASLYANTLLITPKHHYKLDEGSGGNGETVADTGTGTTNNGTLGPAGHTPNWSNGTLDLDYDLVIAANGTLSAPRGTVSLVRNLQNSGTFTHNSGTFEAVSGDNTLINTTGTAPITFHNLLCSGGSYVQTYRDTTVENELHIDSSTIFRLNCSSRAVTLTMGTTSSAGEIHQDGGGFQFNSNTSNAAKIAAASQLFPWFNVAGYNIDWDGGGSGSNVEIENGNYNGTTTSGGGGVTIKLTGDMEMDAFTLSSGDTLDLNGHRAEFSGLLDIDGTIDAENSMIYASNIDYDGDSWDGNTTTKMVITGTGTDDLSNEVFDTIFYNNTHTIGNWCKPTNLIIGGSVDIGGSNRDPSVTDLTIATGGALSPVARTLTVAGDFTTSGGLVNASAFKGVNGDKDYIKVVDHADLDVTNTFTLECWFNAGTFSTEEVYLFDRRGGSSGNAKSFYLTMKTSGALSCRIRGATVSGTTFDSNVTGLNDGKWHHAALVYDKDAADGITKIYVDGKLDVINDTATGTMTADDSNFYIGGRYSGAATWDGNIAEPRFWSVARTSAQIRADMFNSNTLANNTGLLGQWKMTEGTGSSFASTNSNLNGVAYSNSTGSEVAITDAWAGAGTFTYGTSTVNMTGTNKKIYHGVDGWGGKDFYNLTITGSGITAEKIWGSGGGIGITGQLNLINDFGTDARMQFFPSTTTPIAVTGTRTLSGNVGTSTGTVSGGDYNFPGMTFGSTVSHQWGDISFTGDVTASAWDNEVSGVTVTTDGNNFEVQNNLYIRNGSTLNVNKGSIATLQVVTNYSGGTFNVSEASTLKFEDHSSAGFGSSEGALNCTGANAMLGDGTGDYAASAVLTDIYGGTKQSLSCWVYQHAAASSLESVVTTGQAWTGPGNYPNGGALIGLHSGQIYFDYHISKADGSKHARVNSSQSYSSYSPIGNWRHIVTTINLDDNQTKLYVDGTLRKTYNIPTTLSDQNDDGTDISSWLADAVITTPGSSSYKKIGVLAIGNGDQPAEAMVADVRIFNSDIGASGVTTLYNGGSNPAINGGNEFADSSNTLGAVHWYKCNESNFPTDDAADSGTAGDKDLTVTNAKSNRITLTSLAGGTPSNYWDNDTGMDVTANYTTFDKSSGSFYTSNSTIDIDNCTYSNHDAGAAVYFNDTGTITSFTNNTISCNSVSKGLLSTKAHAAFDNITITNSADYDVKVTGERIEFTNSNFDITKVELGDSSSHLISSVHNDTENLYEICAGSGGLTYSAISNKPDIPNGVLRQRTGLFLFNSDNKEFNTLNVFSGATIRVSDTKDMYLTVFDNDGTWDQSTSGYTTGEIHVGDFTPFDSGDIIDETDFVDTGFHDTTHYLEMDL